MPGQLIHPQRLGPQLEPRLPDDRLRLREYSRRARVNDSQIVRALLRAQQAALSPGRARSASDPLRIEHLLHRRPHRHTLRDNLHPRQLVIHRHPLDLPFIPGRVKHHVPAILRPDLRKPRLRAPHALVTLLQIRGQPRKRPARISHPRRDRIERVVHPQHDVAGRGRTDPGHRQGPQQRLIRRKAHLGRLRDHIVSNHHLLAPGSPDRASHLRSRPDVRGAIVTIGEDGRNHRLQQRLERRAGRHRLRRERTRDLRIDHHPIHRPEHRRLPLLGPVINLQRDVIRSPEREPRHSDLGRPPQYFSAC